MTDRLKGKVALISGANSGIGKACAKLFAAEGASVVIGARKFDKTQAVADEIASEGGEALAVQLDIDDAASVEAAFKAAIDKYGKIDIHVANAGKMDHIEAINKADIPLFESICTTNIYGTARTIREAIKYMEPAGGGTIVMTSSQSGKNGGGGAAYVASKSALFGLTKHIAVWGSDHGIRCNCVAPAGVNTTLNGPDDFALFDMDWLPTLSKHIAGQDPCQPEDVANALLFLASDESCAINGEAITIDFGYSI